MQVCLRSVNICVLANSVVDGRPANDKFETQMVLIKQCLFVVFLCFAINANDLEVRWNEMTSQGETVCCGGIEPFNCLL